VITCSRCGTAITAGLINCPQCGIPVNGLYAGGTGPEMNTQQEQPGLPAWLETLRAGEGQHTSPSGSASFPDGNRANNDDLPGWLRPKTPEAADTTPSGSFPSQRPAASPAPNTDGAFMMGGMSASSLIDEQSLPSWMREQQGSSAQMHENISASSLVQPEALPEWMRTAPAPVSSAPVQQQPDMPSPLPAGPIAGNDLVDPQMLPEWMTNGQHGTPARGQNGFSASSLIDANALPSWMRESGQAPQQASAVPPQPPAQLPASFGQVPTSNGQVSFSQAPAPSEQSERRQSGLSAASFIDMNALPDWLRSPEEQRQQGHPLQPQGYSVNAPYQAQAPFANPGRQEALRPPVPSRPRSGMGLQEESEVAANVFASMLGVASAAPYLAGQPQPAMPVPGQWQAATQPQPQQSMLPPARSPQPGNGVTPSLPGTLQGPDSLPGTSGSAMPGAYPNSGQNSMYGAMPQWQGNSSTSYPGDMAMNIGGYPANRPGMPPSSPDNRIGMVPEQAMNNQDQSKPQTKPAKRSIFELIRDWLSRN
jgi:hypothetical protein